MAQTVPVDTKTITTILDRLERLTEDVKVIKEKLIKQEPGEGSDAWWEKELKEADNELKRGNSVSFNSAEEAITWLRS